MWKSDKAAQPYESKLKWGGLDQNVVMCYHDQVEVLI